MRLVNSPPDAPLLALIGASAEWHAGIPPVCAASVRLLDRVHFTVHRGDCVVVHHADPAGARVLLAALAGHPALLSAPGWGGERRCAGHLRVRRCAVRVDIVGAVLDGWSTSAPASFRDTPPAVHLLRASRDGYVTRDDARQWRRWAEQERARGGAVVVVARAGEVGAVANARAPKSARVSESYEAEPFAERRGSGVREVALRHGLLSAWRAPP